MYEKNYNKCLTGKEKRREKWVKKTTAKDTMSVNIKQIVMDNLTGRQSRNNSVNSVTLCMFSMYACVCLPFHFVFVCMLDEGSTVQVVLLQDSVRQAPSLWHVFDVEIRGAKAQPASVQSPAGHIYHSAYVGISVSERRRWAKQRKRNREPQATTNTRTIHWLSIMAIVQDRRQLLDKHSLSQRNHGLYQYFKFRIGHKKMSVSIAKPALQYACINMSFATKLTFFLLDFFWHNLANFHQHYIFLKQFVFLIV